MLQSAPANQRRACRVSWTLTAIVPSQVQAFSLSLEAATRTSTNTSLIKQRWGAVVAVYSPSNPHGDLHSNVKGRGPDCTSADLILLSVTHRIGVNLCQYFSPLFYFGIRLKFRAWKIHQCAGPFPNARGECFLIINNRVSVA